MTKARDIADSELGSLTVDTDTLVVDETNNRVGIGTSSPSSALDVQGDVEVSGGVYLGGTGSANKLDDYETGTFTFTGNGITLVKGVGEYTKIGNQVVCHFRIDFPSTSSTSQASVGGLPFVGGSGDFRAGGAVRFSNAGFDFRINQSEQSLSFGNISGVGNITNEDFSDSTIRGSITYQTD